MADEKHSLIWQDDSGWPDDRHGWVFLGRAVHQLGSALHGEDWSWDTPTAVLVQPLPAYEDATLPDKEFANKILLRLKSDYRSKPVYNKRGPEVDDQIASGNVTPLTLLGKYLEKVVIGYTFDTFEWTDARDFVDARNSARRPFAERWRDLQELIASEAVEGRLRFATRPYCGGDFEEAPSGWWNTERRFYEHRFANCTVSRSTPFHSSLEDWLFVSECDLQRLIGQICASNPADGLTQIEYFVPTPSQRRINVPTDTAVYRTGMQGRPTSAKLLLAELRRQHAQGVAYQGISDCARTLSAWLKEQHPEAPSSGPGATENTLRELYRNLYQAPKQNGPKEDP